MVRKVLTDRGVLASATSGVVLGSLQVNVMALPWPYWAAWTVVAGWSLWSAVDLTRGEVD